MSEVAERFWAKVAIAGIDECWQWTAATARRGYGTFAISHGNLRPAHRFAWELTHGTIPPGLCVLHRCDNPPCVNPQHLFLGTRGDNARDMVAKGRHWSHRGLAVTRGERNGRAKLTTDQVQDIRRRYANGESQSALAPLFGVSRSMVGNIVRGEAWTCA